jgi:tetratricopeptide (TPR) repeat protein
MWILRVSLILLCTLTPAAAQEQADGPTNEKAQKAFKQATDRLRERDTGGALAAFKKADKLDGGRCLACQRQMIRYATKFGEWKVADLAAEEMVAEAKEPRDVALAHYQLASVLIAEGFQRRKEGIFARAHEELVIALAAESKFPDAYFLDGRALAQLRQDDAAKARFEQFAKMSPEKDANRQRALRFVNNPELARARMAPPFEITTLSGEVVSMDDLQGKVVLLDFWATWCEPCREALPHIREVAKKFQGQPLVIISVSLDTDQQKWKAFVVKN